MIKPHFSDFSLTEDQFNKLTFIEKSLRYHMIDGVLCDYALVFHKFQISEELSNIIIHPIIGSFISPPEAIDYFDRRIGEIKQSERFNKQINAVISGHD